ncbi:hypothetical protein FRX31_005965 [Thalictrum thalictroides]|uniref:Uncharacterized protein n=1 Tax=Thalictrum thalictroides TaxID=46969 RepID=A0A7J6X3U1_THATH|nr:hypothetical protein FRX31_005965 [Thalictrum thalictroides]
MAMRSGATRLLLNRRVMEGSGTIPTRYLSSGSGKVLGEEEQAAENVYIKKMERDRSEKLKKKAAVAAAAAAAEEKKSEKKKPGEDSHKG